MKISYDNKLETTSNTGKKSNLGPDYLQHVNAHYYEMYYIAIK
jgi:hypothetical protein